MFNTQIEFIFRLLFLILGACAGSFVTMASYRLVKKEGIIVKRSHCPHCKTTLKIRSLIPIFSWLFQKGKCAHCQKKIGIRYLAIELITAILFLLLYLKFSISLNVVLMCLLITLLMIAIVTDLENYVIPDSIQIFLAVLAFAYIILNNINMSERLISAVVYFSVIYVIGKIVTKLKKEESIGGADIKLITIAGLFLGLKSFANFLFLSGAIGIVLSLIWTRLTGKKRFPFGPALAISLILCLYFL